MINNYSQYIAERGSDKDFLEDEFESVNNFFYLTFEDRGRSNHNRFNYNNLCRIYLILRANNKLKPNSNITIPQEVIYYDSDGYGLNPEGFLYRITEIIKIMIRKGVI